MYESEEKKGAMSGDTIIIRQSNFYFKKSFKIKLFKKPFKHARGQILIIRLRLRQLFLIVRLRQLNKSKQNKPLVGRWSVVHTTKKFINAQIIHNYQLEHSISQNSGSPNRKSGVKLRFIFVSDFITNRQQRSNDPAEVETQRIFTKQNPYFHAHITHDTTTASTSTTTRPGIFNSIPRLSIHSFTHKYPKNLEMLFNHFQLIT